MSTFVWLWLWWGVGFGASFLAIEIPAYRQHQTLSETIRRLLGVGQTLTWRYRIIRILFNAFLIWLFWHFNSHYV